MAEQDDIVPLIERMWNLLLDPKDGTAASRGVQYEMTMREMRQMGYALDNMRNETSATAGSRDKLDRLGGGLPTNAADKLVEERLKERAILSEADRKVAIIEGFGADTHENGTVIRFTRKLGEREYTYAALKTADRWYITGAKQQCANGHTWSELLLWFTKGDNPVTSFELMNPVGTVKAES